MAQASGFRARKHYILYSLILILATRWALSIWLWYQYIRFSSPETSNKGGTFVEAIIKPISYLPYRGNPDTNEFYQNILFPGCEQGLGGNVCEISTQDDQHYTLIIKDDVLWSDGTPFTMDDVLFSYGDIVIGNFWDQAYLSTYQDITLELDEEDVRQVSISFPSADTHNREFFKLPLLPLHVLQDQTLEEYVNRFSKSPVTLGCARLQASKDINSIVFKLNLCDETNINYYQIKLFASLSELQKTISRKDPLVSFYHANIESEAYRLLDIKDDGFMTFFFNTSSTKLTPRIQRSFAWFVNEHFWKESHASYLGQYDGLFDYYISTWTHLADYIEEKNPHLSYDKSLLEQWGVSALPRIFTVNRAQRRETFYLDPLEGSELELYFETPDPVSKLSAVSNNAVRSIDTHSENENKKHKLTLSVGENQQLQEWLNTITVRGTLNGKDQEVAIFDIYYLWRTASEDNWESTINRIKIIGLDNTIENYIRVQLQELFNAHDIKDLFQFVVYDTQEELRDAIRIGDYDMLLTSIHMAWLDDIYAIISSRDTQINPSNYYNERLNTLLQANQRKEVRDIIVSDQPFFILWQSIKPYRLRKDIALDHIQELRESNLRTILLERTSLVAHHKIDTDKLRDRSNALEFLQKIKNSDNIL